MMALPELFLATLQNSPAVNQFFAALTNQSFIDNLFHHLTMDLETGDLFTTASQSLQPEAQNLAHLATYTNRQTQPNPSIAPINYTDPSAFFEHCFQNYNAALQRYQDQQNEQTL